MSNFQHVEQVCRFHGSMSNLLRHKIADDRWQASNNMQSRDAVKYICKDCIRKYLTTRP